jgi:membrane associated rhomboid family serine protease
MLEDRDYMRQPDFYRTRISWTIVLLIVNAACFLAQITIGRTPDGAEFQGQYLALSLDGLKQFYLWQLLTFQFMHANLMHILFNSLAIFFFGRPVENAIGGKNFLALYFSSGIIGGLVQMLFAYLFPDIFGGAVVGASAGASGLVAAFAILHWNEQFTLFFYFFPINMRGRTLLWVSVALALVGMSVPSSVANAAHLGGILTGALFARQIMRGGLNWNLPSFRHEREFAPTRPRKKFWGSSPPPQEDLSAEEFLQTQVDPILEKISAHGIQSLTSREREILEKARSKMTKR